MSLLKSVYHMLKDLKVPFCNAFARIQVKKMGKKCRFHKFCKLTPNTEIGDDCHFNGIEIDGKGRVSIGNSFHSGKNCFIFTSDHNYDKGTELPYDNTYETADVIIEDNVWIGTGVIILKGTILREGCIIQAGSVVMGEVPIGAIAGGHPAKVFKYRDMDHYNELKNKN